MTQNPVIPPLSGHVVICNCNEKVRAIVEELHKDTAQKHRDVVLLIQDRNLWQSNPDWHPRPSGVAKVITLYGNPFDKECLDAACIKDANAAIILADPNQGQLADAQSTLMAVAIEKQNPQVHTIQELILSINRDHLKAMNVDEVVCLGEISEKLIAQSCITPGVKNIFEDLLTTAEGTPQIFLPLMEPAISGMSFREISRYCIQVEAPFIIIGFIISPPETLFTREGRNMIKNSFLVNPKKTGKDLRLSEYDKLIIIAYDLPLSIAEYVLSGKGPP
ncbi:MAG: NAD-binding protein [Proteobacteria bacterium]|nr:NAD-binding protein [Pseudomonadota bacterium]